MVTYENVEQAQKMYRSIMALFNQVLVGQKDIKKMIAFALLCDSNSKVLLTGNTGAGKTTISNFLKNSLEGERISVTSDLIPSEIQEQLESNLQMKCLFIDELNRASGKVQSSLIELLEEHQMHRKGIVQKFPDFYVFATQNNADISGIFTVPQAIYDRFDISLDFHSLVDEEKRALLFNGFEPIKQSILPLEEFKKTNQSVGFFRLQKSDEDVMLEVFNQIDHMKIDQENLFAGTNIRAHKYALKLVKLFALLQGRDHLYPTDIIDFIKPLYMHRIDQSLCLEPETIKDAFQNVQEEIMKIKRKRK